MPQHRTRTRPRFYTVAEVAEILRVDDGTVYRAIHASEMPAVKVRGRYVIPARALDEMEETALSACTVADPADWVDSYGAAA